ncbi:MAG: hypothetical protein WBD71_04920 [Xanthobacteraceae bacterium]
MVAALSGACTQSGSVVWRGFFCNATSTANGLHPIGAIGQDLPDQTIFYDACSAAKKAKPARQLAVSRAAFSARSLFAAFATR